MGTQDQTDLIHILIQLVSTVLIFAISFGMLHFAISFSKAAQDQITHKERVTSSAKVITEFPKEISRDDLVMLMLKYRSSIVFEVDGKKFTPHENSDNQYNTILTHISGTTYSLEVKFIPSGSTMDEIEQITATRH